jgi:alginate O-acetyltransferase complex protein AlgI
MTFTSPGFALFLSIVFLLYWLVFKKTALSQNVFLLAASLFFYTWYNWRFSGLLIISILLNFYIGKGIADYKNKIQAKWLLYLGLTVNLGLFFCFKYFNFYRDWSLSLLSNNTSNLSADAIDLFYPLGISFYTFQVLGYIIDLYNEEINPSRDLLAFSTYITYFPKIVAGPIEPAKKFLSQINVKRNFNYAQATDGMRQILWGLFTKIVIANNCASFTGPIFDDYNKYPGSTLLLGSFFYIFQVYCDFSGYSNMAIGISKLFGIQLTRNFHAPFFSTTISEYWRKWHITLTSWMMKYVFNPISFSLRRYKKTGLIISIIITFICVGLWHGAKWTFFVFGLLHGLYFIPLLLLPKSTTQTSNPRRRTFSGLKKFIKMCGLFLIIMFTAIFFGSNSVAQAIAYIKGIFSHSLISYPALPPFTGNLKALSILFFILLLLIVEWIHKKRSHELQLDYLTNPYVRRFIYFIIITIILLFGSVNHIQFFYAQF